MKLEPGTYVVRNHATLPEKYRTIAISDEGKLFVHPSLAGNEQGVLLCSLNDGAAIMQSGNVTLVSADWMAKEYPETVTFIDKLKTDIDSPGTAR